MKSVHTFTFEPNKPRLWGHAPGREIRAEIETLLDTIPAGDVLKIELAPVEVMDFSFSSELFGKLYSSWATAYPGRAVVLANPSEYVKTNLSAALAALNLLALTVKGVRNWDILGKVSDTDRETLAAVAKRKTTTAPVIAEDLGIKLTTCNQRLRKLSDHGLLLRTKTTAASGGDQYTYTWPL